MGRSLRRAGLAFVVLEVSAGLVALGAVDGAAVEAKRLEVEAARDRLTVALRDAPLSAVLEAVEAEAHIDIRVHGPVQRVVSDRFRGLPIDTALRRLLRPLNVAFVYGPPRGPRAGRLERVVVYPAGDTGRPTPPAAPRAPEAGEDGRAVPAGEPSIPPAVEARLDAIERAGSDGSGRSGSIDPAAAARELEALIADPSVEVRRRALEVAETTRLAAPERLREAAFTDANVQVRWSAMAALIATAGREAAIAAAESALSSGSPQERVAALEALGEQIGGEAGERAARQALGDADPAVRAKATELMGVIEEGRGTAPEGETEADEEQPG